MTCPASPEPEVVEGVLPFAAIDAGVPASWLAEREGLLETLEHQQRIAQMGLVTCGLAHDVMNHVMGISGTAALAQMSGDPRACSDALGKVLRQCHELTETTRAYRQFARRAGAAQDDGCALASAIETAARLVGPLARARGVRLTQVIAGAPRSTGTLTTVVQVLVNLATNAIEACASTHGSVTMSALDGDDGRVRLQVGDTGPGVPEAARALLFRPFSTARGDADETGLGLFVVRNAVRRLGGAIRLRTSSTGTSFTVDLPSALSTSPSTATSATSTAPAAPALESAPSAASPVEPSAPFRASGAPPVRSS